jgi:hypothetical protein
MKFACNQLKQTKASAQVPGMPESNKKNNSGLMTGFEKGLSEAFLFIFSVVLHFSHSFEGERGARL